MLTVLMIVPGSHTGVGQNVQDPEEREELITELRTIARDPDEQHFFPIDRFDDFSKIEEDLVLRTCREAPPGEYWEY